MTITVFCILLFAALLHASWNAIVKASGDKMYAAVGVSGSASLIALVLLPFAPNPRSPACRFLPSPARYRWCIRCWWQNLSGLGYEPDLSADARTAPLLVAIISVAFLGDTLSPLAWLGIGVICLAILAMAFNGRASSSQVSYWR
jgi:drug/metabolite transporter (DMT)-like permease